MKGPLLHIILLLFAFQSIQSSAQQKNQRERIVVNVNNSTAISGETIQYSASILSDLTGKPSNISAILYVELVNRTGAVIRQKLSVENGMANGDIFVPSTWHTGNYQLLAYTTWTKNFNDYCSIPIQIINPFEKNFKDTLKSEVPIEIFPKGEWYSGVANHIFFKLSSEFQGSRSGRVLDAQGNTLSTVSFNVNGIGKATITPTSGANQLLLETASGEFKFIPLPTSVKGKGMVQLVPTKDQLEVKVVTDNISGPLEFQIESSNEVIFNQTIAVNSTVYIPNAIIGNHLVKLSVFKNEELIAYHWYLNFQEQVIKLDPISAKVRSEESITLSLPKGIFTTSITKKYIKSKNQQPNSSLNPLYFFFPEAHYLTYILGPIESQPELIELLSLLPNKPFTVPKTVKNLPESRSEILNGIVVDQQNKVVPGAIVTLGFPETPYQLSTTKTDESGHFSLLFNSPDHTLDAYLRALPLDSGYRVVNNDKWLVNYYQPPISFQPLDSSTVQEIIDRSVNNQIVNAYSEIIVDSMVLDKNWPPAFEPYDLYYLFDDYTRFPTLTDHFTEYIPNVRVRKNRISFFTKYYNPTFNEDNLILLDGIPVSQAQVLQFNPYKVKGVGIINNRIYNGYLISESLLNIETIEGNLSDYKFAGEVSKVTVQGITKSSIHSKNEKNVHHSNKLPDNREQLLWNPNWQYTSDEPAVIPFVTSDLAGDYELRITGVTDNGNSVQILVPLKIIK